MSADSVELTAVTNHGGTHLSDVSTYDYMFQLWDQSGTTRPNEGAGLAYAPNTLGKIQTEGNTDFNLKFASANNFVIKEDLHFNNIYKTTEMDSLNLNFSEAGSLHAKGSLNFSTLSKLKSIQISATLSTDELNKHSKGENVTRTLFSMDYYQGMSITDLASLLTISTLSEDISLTYSGVIYSVTIEGVTKYYGLDDVTISNTNDIYYTTVKNTANELDLKNQASYLVIGGTAMGGASMKSISYLVTAASVPEPTTATLSLLALAGLAARRRRR